MNTNFYSLLYDPTENRAQVYRFSSRCSIPSTTDRFTRPLNHFKCDKLSKQKSINRTCDEVVLWWQKVAEGSTPGYTCHPSVNSIKTRINTLWEEYRSTQAWGKRSSEEQSKASKTFKEKLESLFDIAKPDIEFRLCEDDWKFVPDQRMERKSTFGNRYTKLLSRLERKKIREENHKRRQDQAKEEKEMLTIRAVPRQPRIPRSGGGSQNGGP